MRVNAALLVVLMTYALLACSESTRSATPSTTTSSSVSSPSPTAMPSPAATTVPPAQPRLAPDPAQVADDLVADAQVLRDQSSSEAALVAAARRQQVAYRELARHPDWDAIARKRIPPSLTYVYGRNIDARRQLDALVRSEPRDTLPAWRIDPPAPPDELLGYYRKAEAATGVGWNYLAAINFIESRFGRIVGLSSAGAQGPMQFLPSTFAAYGDGGDIFSPHDSIMAAGRYLAASDFAGNRDHALFRYNNSDLYVEAIKAYADVLAADPAAFTGYYRWDVYYHTTSGDVLLPIGYVATTPIPVADWLATHPQ
ncbi:transglycosylase SLT domain-containing protein [Mycobacterium hubeiense]|uniref:lytic transglycosylase domain-containing protein n=1 Tax=Mycobacterium hubeiense TaxID=1867256 RepID=UPI000C7F0D97|nr:transglycosylase SLT domain-containing protein [Mycobacterium sp. QGD 101]